MSYVDTSSPYSQHKDRSYGRVLHFIYHYCGLSVAENCTMYSHNGILYVKLNEHTKASYKWEGVTPVFEFEGDDEAAVRYYHKTQALKRVNLETDPAVLEHMQKKLEAFRDWAREAAHWTDVFQMKDKSLLNKWIDMVNSLPVDTFKNFDQYMRLCAEIYDQKKGA